MSEGIEWAIHSCALLAALPPGDALPVGKLASFFDLPRDYLAKHLQALSKAGVVHTSKGPGGGYRLARGPQDISLLDIVEAIDGKDPCFQCTEIRRRGPTGVAGKFYKKPCGIARAMWKAEAVWRQELALVKLTDLAAEAALEVPGEQMRKSAEWLMGTLK